MASQLRDRRLCVHRLFVGLSCLLAALWGYLYFTDGGTLRLVLMIGFFVQAAGLVIIRRTTQARLDANAEIHGQGKTPNR